MTSLYSFCCEDCEAYGRIKLGPRWEHIVDQTGRFICHTCGGLLLGGEKMSEEREFAERKNTGKPEMSYVNMNCLAPCATVLTFGAKKYSKNNWKKGMPVSIIIDSLIRHIGDLQDGKVVDDESKLAIIGHIQCNAMFLGNKNNQDDMTPDGSLYK